MKFPIRYIPLAALLLPAGLAAQTQQPDTALTRTVVVEQEYAPLIQDAAKVNVLPRVEEPVVTPKNVEYDTAPLAATQIPADTLPSYAARETPDKATPGYVRLGYGNLGNLDVYADYLFRLSRRDRLGVTVGVQGMDGEQEVDGVFPFYQPTETDWDAYDYRTRAALDYTHRFSRVDLNLAGRFGLRNFNRLSDLAPGKQKFTSGDVHLGLASTDEDLPVQFRAETNLLLYQRQRGLDYEDAREVAVRTEAEAWGSLGGGQTVGAALRMDNVVYRHNLYEDYTALSLTPYYAYEGNGWTFRAGVNVDPVFGFGREFRVSPDMQVQYAFPARVVLYAQAKGGRLLNDFRRLEAINPYADPAGQLESTYELVNAAAGVRVGTLSGFGLHVYGGYQSLEDDTYFRSPSYYSTSSYYPTPYALEILTEDTRNFYAGAELTYSYRDIVTLTGRGTYRHWSADEGGPVQDVLAFKPTFEGDFRLEARPISPLRVYVGYRHIEREGSVGMIVDPVSNLYAGGAYDLYRGLGVYVRLDNLLDKDYRYDWYYPTQGFNILVGVTYRF